MRYIKIFENYFSDGIYYHQSDSNDITNFKPSTIPNHAFYNLVKNYVFMSSEQQGFLIRKYEYKLKPNFDKSRIFCSYAYATDFFNVNINKEEVYKILEDNFDYFMNIWKYVNVDSFEEIKELFDDKKIVYNNDIDIMYLFLTTCNDSWCIIESDIFINYLEEKNYIGFITTEEGIINLALKNTQKINIIDINEN